MKPLRVLYTDDEDDIREIAVFSLELDEGLEVRACDSGEEALALLAQWQPDIILLDYMMPGLDGPATFARMREMPQGRDVPVVFITARSGPMEIAELIAVGAMGVISKPFEPLELAGLVRDFARRSGLDA